MNSGSPSNPERQNQSQPVSNAQQSPKLLTQVRNKMKVLHDSIRTESAYVDWIVRFLRFYRTPNGTWRHPSELRGPVISAFLTYLAVDRQVSASTQNQALCAIVFLYRQVLELAPGLLDGVRATQRKPPAAAIVVDRRFPFNRSQPAPPFRNSASRSCQSPCESRSSSNSDFTLCTLFPRQHHGDCRHTPFTPDRRIHTPAGGCHRGRCAVWQAPAYVASVVGHGPPRPDPEADPNWALADVEIQ